MNPWMIFLAVAIAGFVMLLLGKLFAAIGVVILMAEAVIFAFYMLMRDEDKSSQGPRL